MRKLPPVIIAGMFTAGFIWDGCVEMYANTQTDREAIVDVAATSTLLVMTAPAHAAEKMSRFLAEADARPDTESKPRSSEHFLSEITPSRTLSFGDGSTRVEPAFISAINPDDGVTSASQPSMDSLKPVIYTEDNPPPVRQIAGLTFHRKGKDIRTKKKYRIYQYTLLDGRKFDTTKEIKGVPNLCSFEINHPIAAPICKAASYLGPAIGSGIGSGLGNASR